MLEICLISQWHHLYLNHIFNHLLCHLVRTACNTHAHHVHVYVHVHVSIIMCSCIYLFVYNVLFSLNYMQFFTCRCWCIVLITDYTMQICWSSKKSEMIIIVHNHHTCSCRCETVSRLHVFLDSCRHSRRWQGFMRLLLWSHSDSTHSVI